MIGLMRNTLMYEGTELLLLKPRPNDATFRATFVAEVAKVNFDGCAKRCNSSNIAFVGIVKKRTGI